jgi:hypothetical protein
MFKWLIFYNNFKGETIKEESFNLNDIVTYNIFNSTLFPRNKKSKVLRVYGEWRIELRHFGKLLLTKKFLVIPENDETLFHEIKSEWLNSINKYWSYDSICVKSIENIKTNQTFSHAKMFKSCLRAEWSTFYPDPKSDLTVINEKRLS